MPGCCSAQICCCWGCHACRLCCRFCPAFNESTSTRLAYTGFLFLGTLLMCIMLAIKDPDIKNKTAGISAIIPSISAPVIMTNVIKIGGITFGAVLVHFVLYTKDMRLHAVVRFAMLCHNIKIFALTIYNGTCNAINAGEDCELLVGYLAVYRVTLAMASFFFLMAVFTMGVPSSEGCRAALHNGLWGVKFLFLCCICVGAFLIPSSEVNKFDIVWRYIGLSGALLFIVIQLLLIVEFAHTWTESWLRKVHNGGTKCWYVAMVLCALVIDIGTVIGTVVLAKSFIVKDGCAFNKVVIGINAGLCFLVSFISVWPCVEKNTGDFRAGLLQSSTISAYVMYLTWSALSSEPRNESIPWGNVFGIDEYCGAPQQSLVTNEAIISYIGVVIMFLMVLSSAIRTSHNSYKLGISVPHSKNYFNCCVSSSNRGEVYVEDSGGQKIIRNEIESVAYSYSFFHVMFCLASMYIMMQLTHWYSPHEASLTTFERNWSSVLVKMASSWICILIYFMTLVRPEICPGRLDRSRHGSGRQRHQSPPADLVRSPHQRVTSV